MAKVTRTVLSDGFYWSEPFPGVPGRFENYFARRGDHIEVDVDLLSQGQRDSLGSDDDLAAQQAAAATAAAVEGFTPASDADIASMTVEQVSAYLDSVPEAVHDSELDRVVTLEETRDKPRAGVLSLAGASDDGE